MIKSVLGREVTFPYQKPEAKVVRSLSVYTIDPLWHHFPGIG